VEAFLEESISSRTVAGWRKSFENEVSEAHTAIFTKAWVIQLAAVAACFFLASNSTLPDQGCGSTRTNIRSLPAPGMVTSLIQLMIVTASVDFSSRKILTEESLTPLKRKYE
jgi:hypothetical protein